MAITTAKSRKPAASADKRQSYGNWSTSENAACLGAFFEMAGGQQVEGGKEQERKVSVLFPHWLKRVLHDPDFCDVNFMFQDSHYTDIHTLQMLPWNAEVAGHLRAKCGSLVKRAKDPILKTLVNTIQPAYWAFFNKDGKWPSGKTEADCITFMLRFLSDREHEEKSKARAAKGKPVIEVDREHAPSAPDQPAHDLQAPPQGVLA